MNCPYCEKEMEKGSVVGGTNIRWYPEGADDLWLDSGSGVRLSTGGWVDNARAESWYCADCRVVITPVPEIEPAMDKLKKRWNAFTDRIEQESEKRQAERAAEQHQKKRDKQRKKDPWEV